MDIKIGKYRLQSGSNDFTISEAKKIKTGENKGNIVESNISYHPSIESALNNCLKRRLLASDATTLKEVISELNKHREAMKDILKQEVG